MEQIKKAAEGLRSTIFKSPLEKQLNEATSNDNWGISNTTLHSIADASHDWEQFEIIMKFTWDKVNNTKSKEWRRIYKTLQLLEFLLKFGSPRVGSQISDNMFKLRGLQDFSYQEDGNERGSGVREKARLLVDLMSDQSKLEQEREKSRQIRGKFVGMSGDDTYNYQDRNQVNYSSGGGGGYGNYNSQTGSNYKDRIQGFGSETSYSSQQGSSNYQNQRRDNEWSKGYGGFIEPQGNVEEREKQRKQEWQQQQQQRKDQSKINFSIKPTQTATQQNIVNPAPQTQQQQVQPAQNQNKITIQPKAQIEVKPIKQEQQQPQQQQQAVSLIDFDAQPTQQQQVKTNQNQNLLESLFENPVQTQTSQSLFPNQQQNKQEPQKQAQDQQRNEKINQINSLFNQNQQVTFPNPTQPNLFPGQQIPGMQQVGFQGPQQMPMQGFPGQPPMYYNQMPQQQWGYQQPNMMYQNVGFQQPMQGMPLPQPSYIQQQMNVPSNLKNQGYSMKAMPPGQTNQPQKQQPQQVSVSYTENKARI